MGLPAPHRKQVLVDVVLCRLNQHGFMSMGDSVKEGTLIRRPRFKGRTVSRNSSKVAIVQPVEHRIFLLHTRVSLSIILPSSTVSQCQPRPFLYRLAVVCLDKTTSNEQHVANLYVTSLSLRSNINTLISSASFELCVRYTISFV